MRGAPGARTLELSFALDTLGADNLPHLLEHTLTLEDDGKVDLEVIAPSSRVVLEPAVLDFNPLRALLRVTLNAVLYSTSAGIERQLRPRPAEDAPVAPVASIALVEASLALGPSML